ncbi:Uncharacterized protein APZ42_001059, partial [Daphnia magna]
GANVTEAQPEVTTKVCVSTGTQTSLAISHPATSHGAESGNPVGSSGERANWGCNYRRFLQQWRPRDSGLGERTVVDPDDSGEEAGARERSTTYPPLLGSRAESRQLGGSGDRRGLLHGVTSVVFRRPTKGRGRAQSEFRAGRGHQSGGLGLARLEKPTHILERFITCRFGRRRGACE